jgi:hypothetical protein
VIGGSDDRPNNGMQRTALRAAADAERWASIMRRLKENGVAARHNLLE